MIAGEYNLIHRNDRGRLDWFALILYRVRERYDFIDGFVVVIRSSKRVWRDLTSNYRRGAPDKMSLTMCRVLSRHIHVLLCSEGLFNVNNFYYYDFELLKPEKLGTIL